MTWRFGRQSKEGVCDGSGCCRSRVVNRGTSGTARYGGEKSRVTDNARCENPMTTDAYERIRQLCRGITLRLLLWRHRPLVGEDQFGVAKRVMIARDPDGLESLLTIVDRDVVCPICGESTKGLEALPASLEVEFEKFTLGQFVWAHTKCFEGCAETGEPRGLPY